MKKFDITCPHWGKGGRYVVDPVTGRRVPVDAEKTAAETDQLRQQLAALNVTMPTGINGFRSMIDGIGLSTDAAPADVSQPAKKTVKEKKHA